MIKINLIPPEYIEKLNNRAIIAKAVVVGVVTVSVVVLVSGWHIARATAIELKMNRLQIELKALQADVDKVKAIEAQIAEVQRYLDSINGITKGRLSTRVSCRTLPWTFRARSGSAPWAPP